MNRFLKLAMYIFVAISFSNCKGIRAISFSGEAIQRVTKFWRDDSITHDTSFTILLENAWFSEGIGISQIRSMNTVTSDSGTITTTPIFGYRYFNLNNNHIYEYRDFVDTAKVIKKYRYNDSSRYSGGWNFANRRTTPLTNVEMLKDTIIDNVNYRMCKVVYASFNNITFDGVALARCDKKGTIFNLDTSMGSKIQCPITSLRRFVAANHGGIDVEVKFLSNKFPDSVVKVFNAWKTNETKFPVE